jgi:hypothetical protein
MTRTATSPFLRAEISQKFHVNFAYIVFGTASLIVVIVHTTPFQSSAFSISGTFVATFLTQRVVHLSVMNVVVECSLVEGTGFYHCAILYQTVHLGKDPKTEVAQYTTSYGTLYFFTIPSQIKMSKDLAIAEIIRKENRYVEQMNILVNIYQKELESQGFEAKNIFDHADSVSNLYYYNLRSCDRSTLTTGLS